MRNMKRRHIDLDHWQVNAKDPYPYFWLLSENLPFFQTNEVNAESSFLVSRLKAKSLLLSLIDRGAGRILLIRLCKPSMFTTTFTSKQGSSFFFPLGNLSLCNRKHESDQLPRANPTQAISLTGALGERSSVTTPNVLYLGSVEHLTRFELVYFKYINGCKPPWYHKWQTMSWILRLANLKVALINRGAELHL